MIKRIVKAMLRIFYIFPVKRKRISFICYDAKQYSCSPKAIAEYILKKYGNKYELIWYYRNKQAKALIPKEGFKICKWKTLRSVVKLMTSKYIVTNISVPTVIPYRKSQIKLNTWHGAAFKNYHSSGIIYDVVFKSKKIEDAAQNAEDKNTSAVPPMPASVYDLSEYFVVENDISARVTQDINGFNFHNTLLKIGMPRNDMIIKADGAERQALKDGICERYGLDKDSKILLYAPTFRDNCETDFCKLDFALLQKSLVEKFGGQWVICVRKHHLLKDLQGELWDEKPTDFSDYPDMQDLLVIADAMITDYSSCMWDFSLSPTPKPCFIYASDIERYVNADRGQFYYPIDELPFPLSESTEELVNNIKSFNQTEYEEKVKEYHTKSGRYNFEGNATEKVVDLLLNNN